MKMFKYLIAFLLTVTLSVAEVSWAKGSSGGGGGRSISVSRSFSTPKPSTLSTTNTTQSFGSFGEKPVMVTPTVQPPTSKMVADMKVAQAKQSSNSFSWFKSKPEPPKVSTTPISRPAISTNYTSNSNYANSNYTNNPYRYGGNYRPVYNNPSPVVVQQSGGFDMGSAATGFMLGHMIANSNNHTTVVQQPQVVQQAASPAPLVGTSTVSNPTVPTSPVATIEPVEESGMGFFGYALIAIVIGGVGYLVYTLIPRKQAYTW